MFRTTVGNFKNTNQSFIQLLRKQFKFKSNKIYSALYCGPLNFVHVCNKHTGFRKNQHVPFSQLLSQRRLESKRSIIVQVHSPQSSGELLGHCSRYGSVKSMHHYSFGTQPLHFIVVEFNSASDVSNVMSRCSHAHDGDAQIIPATSPFLWFRADRNRGAESIDVPTVELSCVNGTAAVAPDEMKTLLRSAETVSEQMTSLDVGLRVSDIGTRLRFLTCRQIEAALDGVFGNVVASPFGSSVNGFGREGCDLDVVVRFDPRASQGRPKSRLAFHAKTASFNGRSLIQRHMECIADVLQLFLPGCMNVRRILQARVPIIKYNQEYTGLECDLSLTNMSGVHMSDLLYTLCSVDERVRPLVFAVKYWARDTNLTVLSPGRWITNFGLTLLVLGFLQRVDILPSIVTLARLAEPKDRIMTEDGIDCTFLRDVTKLPKTQKPNTDSLESLLLKFFEHYSSFDFGTRAISLNEGKDVSKPDHSPLFIVNPLEQQLNVSKNVSREELERLRVHFRNAAWILESNEVRSRDVKSDWGLLAISNPNKGEKRMSKPFEQRRLVEVERLFGGDGSHRSVAEITDSENVHFGNEIDRAKVRTKQSVNYVDQSSRQKYRVKRRRK